MGIWEKLGVMLLTVTAVSSAPTLPYANHTVGGAAGWIFNETVATNYAAWASKETFNLGDYLIFHTNKNATVIQTYNNVTYTNCDYDDSGNDTFVYSDPDSNAETQVVVVPLTQQGPNYYFSNADDGDQCDKGMKFTINVNHGQGLPPSLSQPPPPTYSEPPSSDSQNSPPSTATDGNQGENFYNGGSRGVAGGDFLVFSFAPAVVASLLFFAV